MSQGTGTGSGMGSGMGSDYNTSGTGTGTGGSTMEKIKQHIPGVCMGSIEPFTVSVNCLSHYDRHQEQCL